MKEKTADIDILEELIRDYKDEKEFVGEEIIKAIETLIAENKELKEDNEYLKNQIPIDKIFYYSYKEFIPKSKVEELIEEVKKDENISISDFQEYAQEYAIDKLQSLLGKE